MVFDETEFGQIITFYSYKGGVGRSMALANIACLLSEDEILASRRILIIDWDLEAPGLHRFFPSACDRPENVVRPGVIEYFSKLRDLLDEAPRLNEEVVKEGGWKTLAKVHPLKDYLIPDVHPGIDLIKAGTLNSQYAEKVGTFDWVMFFGRFGRSLKAFGELLTNDYSYCLIDSRTGFTDTSGICTMLLPEKLVTVFTPNKQSSQGAFDLAERAIKYRRTSNDLRPLTVFPLPSRIDDAEEQLRKRWRDEYQGAFEQVFQTNYDLERCDLTNYFDEAKLPYKSYFAYGENLAVLRERNEALTLHRAYKSFAKLLTKLESPWDKFDSTELTDKDIAPPRGTERRVFISSALRDLPEHRDNVRNACIRLGMFRPEMIEHLTADDSSALEVSLKGVDSADIYLGVFGFRYGYVPAGQSISITEAEYNRAVERKIPRLIFLMGDEHPVRATDVETGKGAMELQKLKERLKREQVIGFFNSPDELRAQVIQALVPYQESDANAFHYVSDIPTPPEAFIAHSYTLLQTRGLVGRQRELNLLTDWVAGKELPGKVEGRSIRIMSVVAIGGMGKSALIWKWFNDVAPQEMRNLAGRMWWSFYESDATLESFVIRALAYVTERSREEIQKVPAPEREEQLLSILDRDPFLLVLDGLERILTSYARFDAGHVADGEGSRQDNLRKTADPRAGRLLRKLAQVENSRVLVSTRLYPADLETEAGEPIPGTFKLEIGGLNAEDAVELWRAFGVTGSRDQLLSTFAAFERHPLLIQALAGEVKRYRRAPGNFEEWRKSNPSFDPATFPDLTKTMGHVLEFAFHGLDDRARQVLQVIAAFRMPARYETLASLLVGAGKGCADDYELDKVLAELEDRALVGWDKRANRYDLHPIVRGVIWSSLNDETRLQVYARLGAYFEALPKVDNYLQVSSLEDLTPAIELYNALIGLGRYDDAGTLFFERLNEATLWRLSANRQRIELLEMLFPNGSEELPQLSQPGMQAFALNALALSYQFTGQPLRAVRLFRRFIAISSGTQNNNDRVIGLGNLSDTLRLLGEICDSQIAARRALVVARQHRAHPAEGLTLYFLGLTLIIRGIANESEIALKRSAQIFVAQSNIQMEGHVNSHLAQRALWLHEFAAALSLANRAWELAHLLNFEKDFIRAARLQGEAAVGLGDLNTGDERLHHALARARTVSRFEEELPALIALGELKRRQGDFEAARELLDDVWEPAERGPYPLFHADAFNVLAQIERDEGHTAAAIEAATKAYRLAWCDGPPFAYHWGLEKAKQHLKELGAPEPEMPPFDESTFEPMPDVEIDPDDEFHVGSETPGDAVH